MQSLCGAQSAPAQSSVSRRVCLMWYSHYFTHYLIYLFLTIFALMGIVEVMEIISKR